MNWLEWLGVLEIIQLGIIAVMGLLFWMSGKVLRGGKEDEKGSRYWIHNVVGPEPLSSSGVGAEHVCGYSLGSTVDKLARRRDEHEEEVYSGTVRNYGKLTPVERQILADHRLRHGRYDYPPSGPLDGINELRERSDTDRAATRAGQTCKRGMGDEPYEPDRTERSILEGTKAGRCLGVVKPHSYRSEG